MSQPQVSVIIPAYNAARYLPEAIESALGQTLRAHQIIVVDDGSRDDTPDVCSRYGDRIVAIRQDNRGEAGARNTALAAATGEFVALLDADDTCAANRLEVQVRALDARPDAIACLSGHWVFTEDGVTGRYPGEPGRADASAEAFAADLLAHPITMLFRRVPAKGLLFPVGVYSGGDMIFTGLLRRRGAITILPDVLYGYRRHAAQITATGHELDSLNYRLTWLREHGSTEWPDLDLARWERLAWHAMARGIAGHYWARRRPEFLRLRRVLREGWPPHVVRAAELELRDYPDWVWRIKTAVDRWRGARPGRRAPDG